MTYQVSCSVLLILLGGAFANSQINEELSLTSKKGVRFRVPDQQGMTLLAVHYNIDVPLLGVQAGQVNVDVTFKTGNYWIYENNAVQLNPGQKIYYWVLIVVNGAGYQNIEQVWTVPSDIIKTTLPPATTPGTTKPPVKTTPAIPPTTTPRPTYPNGTIIKPPQKQEDDCDESFTGTRFDCDYEFSCDSYPCLIFEDNFNRFNPKIWEHEITAGGGGNWEFQYYVNNRSNSYVKDGSLHLKPTLTAEKYGEAALSTERLDLWGAAGPRDVCTGNAFWGCERIGNPQHIINPIQSARVRTVSTFAFRYGKMEIRAKLPKGDWIWPAIWLLPKYLSYGQWPASGEIDIMESRGNVNYKDPQGNSFGSDSFGSTMHWGPHWPINGYDKTHKVLRGKDLADNFHTYGIEWDENGIQFFFDGQEILDVNPGTSFWDFGGWGDTYNNPWEGRGKMAPFDQEFYLVMNVAVGGTNGFFPDSMINGNGAKPWHNESPNAATQFWQGRNMWLPTWKGDDVAMKIDYVKVWKLKEDPADD